MPHQLTPAPGVLAEDVVRLERLMLGADAGRLNRAACAWRGLISTGVVYYGQNFGGGAEGIAALGREVSRPHGWRDAPPPPPPQGPAGPAWRAVYAALRGPFSIQRKGLSRAIALAPGRPAFRALRGLCHLVARNDAPIRLDPRAIADLRAADEAERVSPWPPLALGMAEYLARRMCRARRLFEEAGRRAPGRAWPVALEADALYYNSSHAEAARRFEDASRLAPDNAWIWGLFGRSLHLKGDPRTFSTLERAAVLEPRSGWIQTWLGSAYVMRGDHVRAGRAFARGARLLPRYDRLQTWYGAYLCRRGRLSEGLRRLRLGARINPFYEVNWYAQASALAKLGRWAAAKKAMTRAVRENLLATWVCGWTDVQDADPACSRVLEELRVLLVRFPRWGAGRAWLGQTALLLRRHDEARQALVAARATRALGAWPSVWLGLLERRLGRAAQARALFAEAAARAPRNAWARAGLGVCALDLGEPATALIELDRALALDPRVGRGLGLLWRALARAQSGLDAEADAADALELYPHWAHWLRPVLRGERPRFTPVADAPDDGREPSAYDAPALVRRARRRLRAGDAEGARSDLSRVLEECVDPTLAEARALRALAHAALGDDDAAAHDLAAACRQAPELAALGGGGRS